jgi:outer membrane protein, heavy metal efflux system
MKIRRYLLASLVLPTLYLANGIGSAYALPPGKGKGSPASPVSTRKPPQKKTELSLEEVIQSTLQHHPLMAATEQERVAAEADLLSARGAFDPSLKAESLGYGAGGYSGAQYNVFVDQPLEASGSRIIAGYRQSGGTFPIYEDQYNTNTDGESRLGIEVPLLRDGPIDRRRTNIAKADTQRSIAQLSIGLRKVELSRGASLAYWDWVAAQQKVEVYTTLLKVAQERNRQIDERVTRGDLPQFDRVDNERAALQRESQLLAAKRSLQKAAFELSLFYRDDQSKVIDVQPYQGPLAIPLPLLVVRHDVESHVGEALKRRPEFARFSAQKEQNSLELDLARNQILPRLDLQVFAARDYGSGSSNRDETELKGGLKIEIPLRTRTQEGRLNFFDAKQREIEFLETFLKERVRTDVRDAVNALDIAAQRVTVARNEHKAARDLAKGELERFELGDSNLIFVNLREQTSADAAVREIEALQDYQKSLAQFEAVLASNA